MLAVISLFSWIVYPRLFFHASLTWDLEILGKNLKMGWDGAELALRD